MNIGIIAALDPITSNNIDAVIKSHMAGKRKSRRLISC
jgi:hypothetical protein